MFFGISAVLMMALMACEKFLDTKPNDSLSTIEKIEDLTKLLSNTDVMNSAFPVLQEGGTDNVYVLPEAWASLTNIAAKNFYVWNDDIFNDSDNNEWSRLYEMIYYANVVLERLPDVDGDFHQKNMLKGKALFFRAFAHYEVAQIFAPIYDPVVDNSMVSGIPIRTTADVSAKIEWSNLEEVYAQIKRDVVEALEFLSELPEYKTDPSKLAAFALLARINLAMSDYESAKKFAFEAMTIHGDLLDYSELDLAANYPIAIGNTEVVFHTATFGRPILNLANGRIDMDLYRKYEDNDYRKQIFFNDRGGTFSFRGSYTGSSVLFSGLTTAELYLILSECEVRLGNIEESLRYINLLLKKRYDGSFTPIDEQDADSLLVMILEERRKELVFRGLRWMDLKRLNLDSRFQKTITRELFGHTYVLAPQSEKYVVPAPRLVYEVD